MDFETVSAEDFGASLTGIGLNLLVRDIATTLAFLDTIFQVKAHRISADFAIVTHEGMVLQLHADGTYHSNPLLGLVPENPPRGGGVEIRLFNVDPDVAATKAHANGHPVLQEATDKPHGLRECYVLDPDGYAWVPSRTLTPSERSQIS
ncbi:VOC family protein [Algirhabdus cladophorae]|uniref:VOC family protein n=1 Tax=Algirhabdus cladophorae TaxID=3377108 RepID=UPI003B848F6E